jgi:hypothetical protein
MVWEAVKVEMAGATAAAGLQHYVCSCPVFLP